MNELNSQVSRQSISSRVERLPNSKHHVFLVGLLIAAWFGESLDQGGMSFLMPVLAKEFKLNSVSLGYLASLSFIGMFIGSLIAGGLADKFGRKKIIIISMLWWGIASALLSQTQSVQILAVLRFLVGVGFGAQVPIGLIMLVELLPSEVRPRYIALNTAFLPLAISSAGFLTFYMLPKFGWQGMFFIEALPALLFILIWKYLPESPIWLESKGRYEEADRIMQDIEDKVKNSTGKPLPPVVDIKAVTAHDKVEKKSLMDLVNRQYLPRIIVCSILFFSSMAAYYGFQLWLSTLLVAKGFSIITSTVYVSLIILGGVPAILWITFLVDKIGRKWSVVFSMVAFGVTAYIYGSSVSVLFLIISGLIFQFFNFSSTMANVIYLPELWSTHVRGTAMGFVFGVGRLGGIFGPIIAGHFMALGGPMAVFIGNAVILILGAIVVALFGTNTKGGAL